jgi:hypothetical protein
MQKFIFYLAFSFMIFAASFSPQKMPEHNPVKIQQQVKKGKKKRDTIRIR